MKRGWWLLALIAALEIGVAVYEYPTYKPWMRSTYEQGFALLNRITGQQIEPRADRFK